MLLTILLKVHKRINGQIDFAENGIFSMEVRELKTELNCSEKSPLFIERIKIRARRGYSVPFAYLPERGRPPFPFFFLFARFFAPCPLQPAEPLRCSSVFSGEAATSNQRNAPADTPPPAPSAHTGANATVVGAYTPTNTDLVGVHGYGKRPGYIPPGQRPR